MLKAIKTSLIAIGIVTMLLGGAAGCRYTTATINVSPIVSQARDPQALPYGVIEENGSIIIRFDQVDWVQCQNLKQTLYYMDKNNLNHLKIKMFNGGGNVFIMLNMIDMIVEAKKKGIYITAHGETLVGSAAVPLFMLADHRTLTPNAYIMMHPVQGMDYAPDEVLALEPQWIALYADIVIRNSLMTKDQVLDIIANPDRTSQTWFTTLEALELRLIHEIKTVL